MCACVALRCFCKVTKILSFLHSKSSSTHQVRKCLSNDWLPVLDEHCSYELRRFLQYFSRIFTLLFAFRVLSKFSRIFFDANVDRRVLSSFGVLKQTERPKHDHRWSEIRFWSKRFSSFHFLHVEILRFDVQNHFSSSFFARIEFWFQFFACKIRPFETCDASHTMYAHSRFILCVFKLVLSHNDWSVTSNGSVD